MHARTFLAGVVTATVAMSAVALTAGSAVAVTDPQPDDTTFTPVAADLIGVGSDTAMHAVKLVADAYNATAPTNKIFTYAACAPAPATCGTITLPSGDITRPNGSGAGKATALRRDGNGNTDIDFARSSSANSTAETNDGTPGVPVRAGHPGDGGVGQRDLERPAQPHAGPDRHHLQGQRHQLERGRRHAGRDRAEDPAGRVRHPQLLRRPAEGDERRRGRRPLAGQPSPRCRSTTTPASRTTPTRSRRSRGPGRAARQHPAARDRLQREPGALQRGAWRRRRQRRRSRPPSVATATSARRPPRR